MAFGENIRKARKLKGWSQRELGKRINSDGSYINRIETGKINPSINALKSIADVLESTLDQLVTGKGEDLEVHIHDTTLAERIKLIDSLDNEDRNALTHIIETMITKKRMRELLDSH